MIVLEINGSIDAIIVNGLRPTRRKNRNSAPWRIAANYPTFF